MASFVRAADAVAAAVEIEKRGQAFYLAARDKAVGADQEFFAFLAEEEKRHEGLFAAMLERIGGLTLPVGSDDGEYLLYVRALLDSHSLFMQQDGGAMLADPFGQAMRFEKDTLLFFIALEEMVPPAEASFVRECADEERRHMKLLAKRMAERNAVA